MGQKLTPVSFRGFHRGMAYEGTVADSLMPQGQLRLIENMSPHSIGQLTRSLGYAALGGGDVVSGTTNPIKGIHYHKPSTSANEKLVYFSTNAANSSLESYYLNGGSWTNKALSFTAAAAVVRCATFLGYIIAVNGTDSPKSWNGDSAGSWGTTNLSSAPTGDLIETFRQQVYIASTTTDTVYWSSIPTGGAITWPVDNNFVLNPNDGSSLAAMRRVNNELIFMKRRYMYRYNGRSLDPDPIIQFGTVSQESTTVFKNTLYFYDPNLRAICAYAGGFPEDISRPIKPLLNALSASANPKAWIGNDFVEFFLGTITTAEGETFTNCSVRYIPDLQVWAIRTTPDAFTFFSEYAGGFVSGTSTGTAYTMESGNSYNTSDIGYQLRTPWYVMTQNPAYNTKLAKLAMFIENATSFSCQIQTDKSTNWESIGQARGYRTIFEAVNQECYRFRLRFTGVSNAKPAIFDGFAMLLMDIDGMETDSATKFKA